MHAFELGGISARCIGIERVERAGQLELREPAFGMEFDLVGHGACLPSRPEAATMPGGRQRRN